MADSAKRPHHSNDSQASSDWRTLHLWQIQPVRDGLVIAAVLSLLYLGYALRVVTAPILLAMTMAYLFEPMIRRVTRISWISRQGAAIGVILLSAIVIVAPLTIGIGLAAAQGVSFAEHLATTIDSVHQSVEHPEDEALAEALPPGFWRFVRDRIVKHSDLAETDVGVRAMDWLGANSRTIAKAAFSTGASAVAAVAAVVMRASLLGFTIFLTFFFFYFFSTGYGRVVEFWEGLVPERKRGRAIELGVKMDRVIAGFVRGRLTIAAIQSVLFAIAYWMIGAPAPLLLGPIIGVLSIVPYVALIGIPVSMVAMWLEPTGAAWQTTWWWTLAAPVGVYFAIQALDDYVLTPTIQGKSTGMDTPSILFATLAGGALAGVYGLLLAIPVAACVKILLTEVVWPKFHAWTQGRAADPLPIGDADETAASQ